MSDIHVLTGDGGRWSVIMHFAVPDAPNAASVSYRTALVNSGLGGVTQLADGIGPGQITPAEKAQVEAGEVYEHATTFQVEGNGASTAAVQANLRKQFVRRSSLVLAGLQARLKYFGHTESES